MQERTFTEFLSQYWAANGYSPSYAEIAEEFGVSKSVVHFWVCKLERDGVITRRPHRARTLRLVEETEGGRV